MLKRRRGTNYPNRVWVKELMGLDLEALGLVFEGWIWGEIDGEIGFPGIF